MIQNPGMRLVIYDNIYSNLPSTNFNI